MRQLFKISKEEIEFKDELILNDVDEFVRLVFSGIKMAKLPQV